MKYIHIKRIDNNNGISFSVVKTELHNLALPTLNTYEIEPCTDFTQN